jgi:hypothetical protein
MSRVSEYRTKAAEFIARAARASDMNARVMLLQMAGTLTTLANTIERNEKHRDAEIARAA